MPSLPPQLPWANVGASDLVTQAAAILTREMSRLTATAPEFATHLPSGYVPLAMNEQKAPASAAAGKCPVTGATMLAKEPGNASLRPRAHELLAALFSLLGADSATQLRRQAHEFIESLLVTLNQSTGEDATPYETQVPLIGCAAPVRAGEEAVATLRMANDEAIAVEVTPYCTNFVADSGYDLPSLRVTISPRTVTIGAKSEASFEIKVAVPQQTPAGIYSGLIQAMGSRYLKAVLSVEVL